MTTRETAPNTGPAPQTGAELELSFTDLLANGQGVGRANGMVVFCFGPLPGERARVRVTDVKQRYSVAELLELLETSPMRAQPFCPVFGECGGCQLQHLTYDAQLEWKRRVVRDALERIGGVVDVDVRPVVGMAEPRAYRNKMSLVVDRATNPPAFGFYKQRSHDIVRIGACPIVTTQLDAGLERLDSARGEPAVRAMLEDARHVVARGARTSGQSVLTITTDRPSKSAERAAPALMREFPGLAGVTNSFDPANANAILGRKHRVLAGDAEIEESIGGVRYRVSPESFFQVNVEIVGRILEALEPWLERPQRIVDLYCGAGTFALFFAKRGWSVVGVEENARAVAEAEANARRNGLATRVAFETGRVEQLVGEGKLRGALRDADVIFLDPPRKGCDVSTLAEIAEARVPSLWYLSCDPATLARDLKFLMAKGYRLGVVQPFDMFPQTGHVETLVKLESSNLATREH